MDPENSISIRVGAYNSSTAQFFVYALEHLYTDTPEPANQKRPLLMLVSSAGDEIRYVRNENVIIKKSLDGAQVDSDTKRHERFVVFYTGETVGWEHITFKNEFYREEIVELLKACIQPKFKQFTMKLVRANIYIFLLNGVSSTD